MVSNQPKFQIFVSSTFKDLEDERRQIIKATLEMGHIPVGMEMFSAADEEQRKVIQRQIDISDYYVVIAARRYGSRTPEGISYTEKEYRYALETNIPIIGFVLDSDANWDDKRSYKVRKDIKSLKEFKVLVQKKPVAFFTNPDDLSTKYSIALIKLISTNPRIGWVRADQISSNSTLEEFTRISKENEELREKLLLIGLNNQIEDVIKDLLEIKTQLFSSESEANLEFSIIEVLSNLFLEFLTGVSEFAISTYFVEGAKGRFIVDENILRKWLSKSLKRAALYDVVSVKYIARDAGVFAKSGVMGFNEYTLTEFGRKVILGFQKRNERQALSGPVSQSV